MTTATRPLPAHGSEARYQGAVGRPGCRCRTCITGWNNAHQRRLLAHLQGRPPKIDPAPVIAHIKSLLASEMTLNQIADTADVDFTTVRGHARGDFPAIRRTTATKILAVRPQQLSPTSRVNAVGTRRRLQALYADGHGPYLIARAHPSLNSRVLEYIVSGERAQVTVATRDAVADVYRTLAGQPGNSPTSRRTAAANNWPDADYWEDAGHIDDPDFDPDPDAAETPLSRNELAALRKADVEHLASYGIDEDEIAERVGLAKSTVHALVEEWRTGAKRDRRKQQVSA